MEEVSLLHPEYSEVRRNIRASMQKFNTSKEYKQYVNETLKIINDDIIEQTKTQKEEAIKNLIYDLDYINEELKILKSPDSDIRDNSIFKTHQGSLEELQKKIRKSLKSLGAVSDLEKEEIVGKLIISEKEKSELNENYLNKENERRILFEKKGELLNKLQEITEENKKNIQLLEITKEEKQKMITEIEKLKTTNAYVDSENMKVKTDSEKDKEFLTRLNKYITIISGLLVGSATFALPIILRLIDLASKDKKNVKDYLKVIDELRNIKGINTSSPEYINMKNALNQLRNGDN